MDALVWVGDQAYPDVQPCLAARLYQDDLVAQNYLGDHAFRVVLLYLVAQPCPVARLYLDDLAQQVAAYETHSPHRNASGVRWSLVFAGQHLCFRCHCLMIQFDLAQWFLEFQPKQSRKTGIPNSQITRFSAIGSQYTTVFF